MQFKLVSHHDGQRIYIGWQWHLCFTIMRYDDDTPDNLSIWDHAADELVLEREIPKSVADVSFFTTNERLSD